MYETVSFECKLCGNTSTDMSDFKNRHLCKRCYDLYVYYKYTLRPKLMPYTKHVDDKIAKYEEYLMLP